MTVTDTSLMAYAHVLENLAERHLQVYKAIHHLKSATNEMIAEYLELPINRVTGRTNELRNKLHVVMLDKKDICPVTGGRSMFWKVRRRLY